MSEKYTEYLIYVMKKNKENKQKVFLNLEDLRYLNVIEILNFDDENTENILKNISSSSEENQLENLDDNDADHINLGEEQNLNEDDNNSSKFLNKSKGSNNKIENQQKLIIKNSTNQNPGILQNGTNENSSKNVLNNAVSNSINEKNSEQQNKKNNEEEEEEEVIITIEQFNEKVDRILSKLADYLLNNKKTVKEFFYSYISIHNITTYDSYEAITLKDFIQILQNIGVLLDTIDIYCIFTKLKYNDDYETIDVNKLLEEMLNYGIFEDNFKGFCNPILENQEENKEITENSQIDNNLNRNPDLQNEFLINLNNNLKMKNLTFDEFISTKINLIKIFNDGNTIKKLIKLDEFMKYCREMKIITEKNYELDPKIKDLICEQDNDISYINIQKVSNCIDKMEKEFIDCEYEFDDNEKLDENEDNEYIDNFDNFDITKDNKTSSKKLSAKLESEKNKNSVIEKNISILKNPNNKKSLNSSLDLDNIEDMEVEGLD